MESDLNRLVLRLELEHFRQSTARLDATLAKARRVSPWVLPLISALGFFTARRARNATFKGRWINRALRYLPILLQLRRSKAAAE